MQIAVLVGPGLPRGRRAAARLAFGGAAFQAHLDIAGAMRLPTALACPDGPVPVDSEVVGRRWPRHDLAAAAARWAADHDTVIALADDDDATAWRSESGGRIQAPLVGMSVMQRQILATAIARGSELPPWSPIPISLAVAATRFTPTPVKAREPAPALKSLSLQVIEEQAPVQRLLYPEAGNLARPRTRAECKGGPRPCPWVGCKHNLFLEVDEFGEVHFRQPGVEPWDVKGHSCTLDIADEFEEGMRLVEVGEVFGVCRERVRQISDRVLERLRPAADATLEYPEEGPAEDLP